MNEIICPSLTYWASALPAFNLGATEGPSRGDGEFVGARIQRGRFLYKGGAGLKGLFLPPQFETHGEFIGDVKGNSSHYVNHVIKPDFEFY